MVAAAVVRLPVVAAAVVGLAVVAGGWDQQTAVGDWPFALTVCSHCQTSFLYWVCWSTGEWVNHRPCIAEVQVDKAKVI